MRPSGSLRNARQLRKLAWVRLLHPLLYQRDGVSQARESPSLIQGEALPSLGAEAEGGRVRAGGAGGSIDGMEGVMGGHRGDL